MTHAFVVQAWGCRVSIDFMHAPRLDNHHEPAAPRAVVLMLHGGQEHSVEPVSDRHLSWWRVARMAKALRSFAGDESLSLHVLQYGQRGWNGSIDPAPVRDARWALDQVSAAHPTLPVVLVGHSMGGRTACRVADHPHVVGVVALAPWLPEGEPNHAIADRHLRVIHGTRDKWTSARWSREYVGRSQPIADSATWQSLPGAGHFMLRHVSAWNGFVKDSITDILASASPSGEAPSEADTGKGRA